MTGDVPPARLVAAHEAAVEFYRTRLLASPGPAGYLAQRGLEMLARPDLPWRPGIDLPWRLGYAPPGWTTLLDHLHRSRFTGAELEAAGLATRTRAGRLIDRFRDRIMFPVRAPDGHPIGFLGRIWRPDTEPDTPKYLNSPDTTIYHKGQTLFGMAEQADRLAGGAPPVLVEGPLDAIAVWLAHPPSAGLPRVALASCGTAFTPEHTAILCALPGARQHGVTVAYDADPAGIKATDRAWDLLADRRDIATFAASLPDGADPADLIGHPDRIAALRAGLSYRARPLGDTVVDHLLERLIARYPKVLVELEGRIALARAAAKLLARMPADDVANRLVPYLAEVTDLGLDTVLGAVLGELEEPTGPASTPRGARGPRAPTGTAAAFPTLRPGHHRGGDRPALPDTPRPPRGPHR